MAETSASGEKDWGPRKAKRTYRLSHEAIETVRRLVEVEHAAPSQDAVVEKAIRELARTLGNMSDAKRWAQAATDPEFQAEAEELEAGFAVDDWHAWQR